MLWNCILKCFINNWKNTCLLSVLNSKLCYLFITWNVWATFDGIMIDNVLLEDVFYLILCFWTILGFVAIISNAIL